MHAAMQASAAPKSVGLCVLGTCSMFNNLTGFDGTSRVFQSKPRHEVRMCHFYVSAAHASLGKKRGEAGMRCQGYQASRRTALEAASPNCRPEASTLQQSSHGCTDHIPPLLQYFPSCLPGGPAAASATRCAAERLHPAAGLRAH